MIALNWIKMGRFGWLIVLFLGVIWGAVWVNPLPAQAQDELWYFIDAGRDQISYIETRLKEFRASVEAELFQTVKEARWHIEILLKQLEAALKGEIGLDVLQDRGLEELEAAIGNINAIDLASVATAKGYAIEALDGLISLVLAVQTEGIVAADNASQLITHTEQIKQGVAETGSLLAGTQAIIDHVKDSLVSAKGELEALSGMSLDSETKRALREAKWSLLGAYRELKRVLGAEGEILNRIREERFDISSLTGILLKNLLTLRPESDPLLSIREEIIYEFEDLRDDLWDFHKEVQEALGRPLWQAKLAVKGGISEIQRTGALKPHCSLGDLDGDGIKETCAKEALDIVSSLDLGGIGYIKGDMENIAGELIALINRAEDDGLLSAEQATPLRQRLETILNYMAEVEEMVTAGELHADEAKSRLDDAILTFIYCTYDEPGDPACGDDPNRSEDRQVRSIRKDLSEGEWLLKKGLKAEWSLLEGIKYIQANLSFFLLSFLAIPPVSQSGTGWGWELGAPLEPFQLVVAPDPSTMVVRFAALGWGITITAIQVEVYDLAGRRIFDSGFIKGNQLIWDLRGSQGSPVANGVYLYKISVKSPSIPWRSKVGKLVVLR